MVFSQATSINGRVVITMTYARPMGLHLYVLIMGGAPKLRSKFSLLNANFVCYLIGIRGKNDLRFSIHTNAKTSGDLVWFISNRGKKAFQSVLICV